jgi:hypothetical protein
VDAVRNLLASALAAAVVLVPFARHLPLDPDEPLAADGALLMKLGRLMRTIRIVSRNILSSKGTGPIEVATLLQI